MSNCKLFDIFYFNYSSTKTTPLKVLDVISSLVKFGRALRFYNTIFSIVKGISSLKVKFISSVILISAP